MRLINTEKVVIIHSFIKKNGDEWQDLMAFVITKVYLPSFHHSFKVRMINLSPLWLASVTDCCCQ